METMNMLFHAIPLHFAQGLAATIDKWHCVHAKEFGLRIEGTLVSPKFDEVLRLFPCGTFQCASCRVVHVMDQITPLYINTQTHSLVCQSCTIPSMAHLCKAMNVRIESNLPFPSSAFHTYEDMRPHTAEEHDAFNNKYHIVCQNVAEHHGLTYLNGRTLADVRTELLSRRLVQRWRAITRQRHTARVFRVLYHCTDIGMDASVVLAKQVC